MAHHVGLRMAPQHDEDDSTRDQRGHGQEHRAAGAGHEEEHREDKHRADRIAHVAANREDAHRLLTVDTRRASGARRFGVERGHPHPCDRDRQEGQQIALGQSR